MHAWGRSRTADTPDFGLPPSALYKAILTPSFQPYFPSRLSAELCSVVRGFLTWNSLNRLGCLTSGAADVRAHPFFAVEDWSALDDQRRPAPFVPQIAHVADTANFRSNDSVFEQQEDDAFVREQPEVEPDPSAWDYDF